MERAEAVVRRAAFGNPTVRDRGAGTRQRILRAALDVFAEHGFHDAKVELITDAAGCSRPTFYQYFASKDEVFWHLAGRVARDMERLAEDLDGAGPDESGLELLRSWVIGMIALHERYAPVFASFEAATRETVSTARRPTDINTRIGARLAPLLPGATAELGDALAGATATTMVRAIQYWQRGAIPLPRKRFVDGLARTAQRLRHGPIDGLNVVRLVRMPRRPVPAWPAIPRSPSHARPSRANGRRTLERLLDAASTVLPERGYHATTVDHVVAGAGMSHGGFYRHFENIDDLFHVLAERAASEMLELTEDFPTATETDALHRWLGEWFRSYRRHGGVISVWHEIMGADADLARYSTDVALAVLGRLSRIVQARGFGDSTVDGLVLLALVEGVPHTVAALGYMAEQDAVDASLVLIQRGIFGLDTDLRRLGSRERR